MNTDIFLIDFRKKFKRIRESEGYNQAEFGELLGLTQQSVSQIESGRTNPSKTLMAYLKYRYADIFDGVKEDNRISDKDQPELSSLFKDPKRGWALIDRLSLIEFLSPQMFDMVETQVYAVHKTMVEMDHHILIKKYANENRNQPGAASNWYHHCLEEQIPYIVVKERTKFADVEWDYITYYSQLDTVFRDNEEFLKREFENIFNRYSNPKSGMRYTCFVITCETLFIEDAYRFASELFDVIYSLLKPFIAEIQKKKIGKRIKDSKKNPSVIEPSDNL